MSIHLHCVARILKLICVTIIIRGLDMTQLKLVTVRLPEEVYAILKKCADKELRSVPNLVCKICNNFTASNENARNTQESSADAA